MTKNNGRFKKGRKETEKQKEKRLLALRLSIQGSGNNKWKGDAVGYNAVHGWISRWKGKPDKCEVCGKDKLKHRSYQWANIDHQYRRVLEDYIRMCVSCHRKYDYENHLSNIGSRGGSVKNKHKC